MTVGSLTGIAIYPIKSCRRVELDRVELSETGLASDREWQIVAANGTAITQRHNRVLATIEPVLMADGLRISAPGQRSIEVTRPPANDRSVFALLGDEVPVGDAGEVVAAWLTELLGKPSRLVALTRESDRRIDLVKAQAVTFVDAAPVLVTNAASLADLEARATASFGMERFRPNLVVDASAPWVEDTWTRLDVGGSRLRTLMSWPRCAIPQIDQDTAERSKEPALVLRAHRWCHSAAGMPPGIRAMLEGNAMFGIACTIGDAGTFLEVGDPVVVHERGEPLILDPPFVDWWTLFGFNTGGGPCRAWCVGAGACQGSGWWVVGGLSTAGLSGVRQVLV